MINQLKCSTQRVLVVNASAVGSLAVIRSLWRAGHKVYAVDSNKDAIGFFSNGTYLSEVAPEFSDMAYLDWLKSFIHKHSISVIIPNEDFLLTIQQDFEQFCAYLPISNDYATVLKGLSKWDLFDQLASDNCSSVSSHLPKHLLITNGEFNEANLAELTFPVFIKFDQTYLIQQSKYSGVHKADTHQQASNIIKKSSVDYHKLLIQEYCPGIGCGVFLLVWGGEIKAQFMHLRCHEVPYTGGVSSYRKSWWHQEMYQDAVDKIIAMNWQGVVMVEYRWQPETDQFQLMEMNCRFWGSLHLPLFAGIDFPKLLLEHHLGLLPQESVNFNQKISCRLTFPKEVHYLNSVFESDEFTLLEKLAKGIEFFYLMLDPNVKSDFWFPGDRLLYWRRLWRFLKSRGG